jgi:hypothetical protein
MSESKNTVALIALASPLMRFFAVKDEPEGAKDDSTCAEAPGRVAGSPRA